MHKNFLAGCLIACSLSAQGQFVVSSGTSIAVVSGASQSLDIVIESIGDVNFGGQSINFGTADVDIHLLAGSGSGLVLSSSNPITVGSITLNSSVNYKLSGNWTVLNDMQFMNGILTIASPDNLLYQGSDLAKTNTFTATSFIQGPMSIQSSGARTLTYPVGNADGFFPVQLNNVTDVSVVLGLECIQGDPNSLIIKSNLPEDIDSIFSNRYWQLSVVSGTFSGSPIALSLTGTDTFLNGDKAVVIEKDAASNSSNDLQGSTANSFVLSDKNASANGGIYAIAKSEKVTVKIHKLITPNNDSFNETLVIEGLDFYPENKVTLLDRYGAVYFEKQNFVNYKTNSPQQTDFDYTRLNVGNYICVVEYKDLNGNTQKPKPQMISVLK